MLKVLLDALLSQGFAGVIIAGMSLWIWQQQKHTNHVQEQRVIDALKFAQSAHELSSALERNTDTLKDLLLKD